jgi:hypothetical protein
MGFYNYALKKGDVFCVNHHSEFTVIEYTAYTSSTIKNISTLLLV